MLFAPTLILSIISSVVLPSDASFLRTGRGNTARTAARSILQRQYRPQVQSRDIADTCLAIGATTLALVPGLDDSDSTEDLCLCLDNLDATVYGDSEVLANVPKAQLSLIAFILRLVVNLFPSSVTCDATPDHSTRVTRGCDGSPCTFVCDPLYTESDGACVCASPNFECNGVCVASGTVCGSTPARAIKREVPRTLESAEKTCQRKSVCGVPGLRTGFECIDVTTTLDSCGGCIEKNPWESEANRGPVGRDCNILAATGAVTFGCQAGQCVVNSCRAGYKPNADASGCVSTEAGAQFVARNLLNVGATAAVAVDASAVTATVGKVVDAVVDDVVAVTATVGKVVDGVVDVLDSVHVGADVLVTKRAKAANLTLDGESITDAVTALLKSLKLESNLTITLPSITKVNKMVEKLALKADLNVTAV